ncbi:MAG: relaxase/mobilization nuclease domain-containing protein [Rikenellaceae bacterium]|nr:relaxase/mobilization nuclease domain-containing protein [Rikenellaceae bacterium]
MIAKNIKGKSFGGCIRYVLNEEAELLEADGVLAEDVRSITKSFAIQRSGRPEIKQPVGHIPLSFSPEDSPRMTNDFMLQLAHEYMEEMGIRNTQYIVVRHHDTDNPHIHIVYNRIDNDLKLISVNNDYRRNIKVCKKLKDRNGLTYGKGKDRVKREKLHGADKVKYQIHDHIKSVLPLCRNYHELEINLHL